MSVQQIARNGKPHTDQDPEIAPSGGRNTGHPSSDRTTWTAAQPSEPEPRLGIKIVLRVATLLVGLGTTSSSILELTRRRLVRELGAMPRGGVAFLAIDGDRPDHVDIEHFFHLIDGSRGVFGFGTNAAADGLEVARKNSPQIYNATLRKLQDLLSGGTTLFPDTEPHRVIRVGLLYGPGGVSSSTSMIMETIIRDAIKQLGVGGIIIDHEMIGPGVCINATDRHVADYQRAHILSNHAQALQRESDRYAAVPDPRFAYNAEIPSGLRVIDQTNLTGATISTMREFVSMHADSLFHEYLSPAGQHAAARRIDGNGTGQFHGPIQ